MRGMRKMLIPMLLLVAVAAVAQEEVNVLKLPGMANVQVRANVAYDGTRTFDLYRPPNNATALPLVVFVNGVGLRDLKDWGQYTSWPRLVATKGLAAIAYQTDSGTDALAQTEALLRYVSEHAGELRVDPKRIALWACSANVRVATALLAARPADEFRAAALYYGSMTTPPKHAELPLLVARAGLDQTFLNRSIDAWVAEAVKLDAPLSFFNYPEGRHGFDLLDDTAESKRIVAATLDFLHQHLTAPPRTTARQLSPAAVEAMIAERGVDAAIARLRELHAAQPSAMAVQESTLNGLGYGLMETNVAASVKLLEFVVSLHPDSPNAYDSLGDAYERAGDAAKAIAASEKALALLANAKMPEPRKASIRQSAEAKLARLRK